MPCERHVQTALLGLLQVKPLSIFKLPYSLEHSFYHKFFHLAYLQQYQRCKLQLQLSRQKIWDLGKLQVQVLKCIIC